MFKSRSSPATRSSKCRLRKLCADSELHGTVSRSSSSTLFTLLIVTEGAFKSISNWSERGTLWNMCVCVYNAYPGVPSCFQKLWVSIGSRTSSTARPAAKFTNAYSFLFIKVINVVNYLNRPCHFPCLLLSGKLKPNCWTFMVQHWAVSSASWASRFDEISESELIDGAWKGRRIVSGVETNRPTASYLQRLSWCTCHAWICEAELFMR